jgi:branched-chain amino acid transport system substrate-binding protein
MCFADSNQGSASAVYFNENFQGKQIGIFYKSDEDYSTGIRKTFLDALDASLKTGIKEASFQEGDTDFTTQVNSLKECDVIFMPIYYTPASQFMTKGKDIVKANAIYYGCDGLGGIDAIDGFNINNIPQEVSYLSHFNSGATTGAAKTLIDKYNAEYNEETEPLNQFGAAAYDCVWAIYEALKVAKANGVEFDVTTSPADFCEILTDVFTSDDFVFHGVTGKAVNADGTSNISWSDNGFVNKEAVKYVVKAANSAQ